MRATRNLASVVLVLGFAGALARSAHADFPAGPHCGDVKTAGLPEQDDSLVQDGIRSSCQAAKSCPGGAGPDVGYVQNSFLFDTGSDACVTVTLVSQCSGSLSSRVVGATYLGSHDPQNICATYLGDPGQAVGCGASASWDTNVPDGETLVVVVNEVATAACGLFCFTLSVQTDPVYVDGFDDTGVCPWSAVVATASP